MALSRRRFLSTGSGLAASALILPTLGNLAGCTTLGALAVSFGSLDIAPEITPTSDPDRMLNPFMGGYGIDRRMSAGPGGPLYARCTVLWDNGTPNAIVTADVLAFGPTMHQQIRDAVTGLGIGSSDFILTATHTHHGPVLTEKLHPYIAYNLTPGDLDVVDAYSSLTYHVASADLSYNRMGLSYVETAVPILVARGTNGEPLVVMFSYGTHPVSSGDDSFNADYPGVARNVIEQHTGAFAQFILGAAGDQNPRGDVDVGTTLGTIVTNTVNGTPGRTLATPIFTALDDVDLPWDITFTTPNLQAVIGVYQNRALAGGANARHAGIMIDAVNQYLNTGTGIDPVQSLPLQVWRFGAGPSLRLALTGGELVSGYAVLFRNLFGGAENLLIGGYANEVPCYIPSDEILAGLNYEGGRDAGSDGVAGGSLMWYGCGPGHFLAGPGGVESTLVQALQTMLA